MKEVARQVRTYYIDKLIPLQVDGQTIPVVNIAVGNTKTPFVIINSSAAQDGTKCTVDWNVTTTMQIVTKTTGNYGGDAMTEAIVNEIYDKIERPYGETTDFKIVTQIVESDSPSLEIYNNGRVILKTLTINNYVSEK